LLLGMLQIAKIWPVVIHRDDGRNFNTQSLFSITPDQIPAALETCFTAEEFMQSAHFDPDIGYYRTGRVRFGIREHFMTLPQGLAPVFGNLVAAKLFDLWQKSNWQNGRPIEIVETGVCT